MDEKVAADISERLADAVLAIAGRTPKTDNGK
jgi:hypothetical protein